MEKKNTRGGARPGAGRKKVCVKQIVVKIPADVERILAETDLTISGYVVAAIREKAERDAAKEK